MKTDPLRPEFRSVLMMTEEEKNIMTVKTTTALNGKTTAAPALGHDCCGGDDAFEPQNKTAKPANPAAVGHAKPSKAAETCCCGGAGTK